MAITGAPGGTGVNESFKTVDTDTKRILFRYTTRFGDSFSVGDTVNGWEISEVAYFGNKLRAGYMELKEKARNLPTIRQLLRMERTEKRHKSYVGME